MFFSLHPGRVLCPRMPHLGNSGSFILMTKLIIPLLALSSFQCCAETLNKGIALDNSFTVDSALSVCLLKHLSFTVSCTLNGSLTKQTIGDLL